MCFYRLIRPILFSLPEETAHEVAIFALRNKLMPGISKHYDNLSCILWGLTFDNPIGLAAGFDKNAEVITPLLKQGFGFVEAGTVTPRPQPGNAKPRIFRLEKDKAIINRLGFNNEGMDAFSRRLRDREKHSIVGANIGRNKSSPNDASDYITLLNKLYGLSDYITVNISSPNTQNLRDLQEGEALNALLSELMNARNMLAQNTGNQVPLLVKIAPDMGEDRRKIVAEAALKHKLDGLIISNTTVAQRDMLKTRKHANELGGLSGRPLFEPSTALLANMYRLTEGQIPLVGVGGVFSGQDAYAKIRSGASLVQLYTALVYEGPGIITRITRDLSALLKRDGFTNVSDAVGVDVG